MWEVQKNQILTNIIMFIPVGVLTFWIWKWRGLYAAVGLSCIIELLQLVTSRGLFEFDDMIHNIVGAVLGAIITLAFKMIFCRDRGM